MTKEMIEVKFNRKHFKKFMIALAQNIIESVEEADSLNEMLAQPSKAFCGIFAWMMDDVEKAVIKTGVSEVEARQDTMRFLMRSLSAVLKLAPEMIDSLDKDMHCKSDCSEKDND